MSFVLHICFWIWYTFSVLQNWAEVRRYCVEISWVYMQCMTGIIQQQRLSFNILSVHSVWHIISIVPEERGSRGFFDHSKEISEKLFYSCVCVILCLGSGFHWSCNSPLSSISPQTTTPALSVHRSVCSTLTRPLSRYSASMGASPAQGKTWIYALQNLLSCSLFHICYLVFFSPLWITMNIFVWFVNKLVLFFCAQTQTVLARY